MSTIEMYKLSRFGTKSLKIYSRFVHCLVLGLTSHERQHLVPQTLGLQQEIKSVRERSKVTFGVTVCLK